MLHQVRLGYCPLIFSPRSTGLLPQFGRDPIVQYPQRFLHERYNTHGGVLAEHECFFVKYGLVRDVPVECVFSKLPRGTFTRHVCQVLIIGYSLAFLIDYYSLAFPTHSMNRPRTHSDNPIESCMIS